MLHSNISITSRARYTFHVLQKVHTEQEAITFPRIIVRDGPSYSTPEKGRETKGKCHYPASVPFILF